MADDPTHLDAAGGVTSALTSLGFGPILVGGMALVALGSRRVTRDFDFVIAHPGQRLDRLVDVFYARGFELASRLSGEGEVIATIDNRRVAAIRLRLDAPSSAFFLNPATRLRIDVLFDFPIAAETLARRALRVRLRSHAFHIASEEDLLALKKIARAHRDAPGDAEDIAFLERRRRRRRRQGRVTRARRR
jgi:hypothetical protein